MKRLLTMFVVPIATLIGAGCSSAPAPAEAELAEPGVASCESLVAAYTGSGSTDDAANFVCQMP